MNVVVLTVFSISLFTLAAIKLIRQINSEQKTNLLSLCRRRCVVLLAGCCTQEARRRTGTHTNVYKWPPVRCTTTKHIFVGLLYLLTFSSFAWRRRRRRFTHKHSAAPARFSILSHYARRRQHMKLSSSGGGAPPL